MQDTKEEHYAYAQNLKKGKGDFLLLETMITLQETLAALQAAQQLAVPFAVSFCTNDQGNLLDDTPLVHVVYERLYEGT